MKRNLNNRSGFTLLEIIVVLIIIGILATIAVPNLFSNVAKSKAGEAFANISSIRPGIEACIAAHPNQEASSCSGGQYRAFSANFSYYLTNLANGNTIYELVAYGLGPGGVTGAGSVPPGPFVWGTDYIVIFRSSATTPAVGTISCQGYGVLVGAC